MLLAARDGRRPDPAHAVLALLVVRMSVLLLLLLLLLLRWWWCW
jgi:hypothetical protein